MILFLYFSQRNGEVLFRNSNIFSCAKFCSFSIACCYLCQFFHGCVVWNRWTFTSITIYFGVCSSIFEEPCFHICSSLSISLLFQSLFAHNLQFSVHSLDHYSPLMAATSIRRKLVVRKWIMWREMQNKALLQVEMVQLLQIQRKIHPFVKNIVSYVNVQDFGVMSFRLSSRLVHCWASPLPFSKFWRFDSIFFISLLTFCFWPLLLLLKDECRCCYADRLRLLVHNRSVSHHQRLQP